jgi:multiple sugar transport system substrate-binding protein
MIDMYTKEYPNRKVTLRPIPIPGSQQEAYPKMYAMYAAGTLGDNIAFDPSHWEFYRAVPQGILRPLDDYVAQDKLDLTQWFQAFIDMQHYKGKMWGLPSWGWTGQDGLHFNEVALQEAGLAVPDQNSPDWTMDKIREYANKLMKKSGSQVDRYGIDLAMGAAGVTIVARAWGADILSDDGKKMLLTDPKVEPALKWIYDICQTDKIDALPGSIPSGQDNALFSSGKIGILQGGSLSVTELDTAIKDPKVAKLKSVLFPKRPDGKRPNQLRGGTWNVNSKSQHPYEAWEFIKVLSSQQGILLFNTEGDNGALTRPDVLKDPFFTKNPNFQVFIENLNNAILAIVPANARGTEYETTFTQSFANIYLGKYDFNTAVQKTQDAVQAVLDKPST